ncbi:unnamed protein product [Durusdinium trenchii]|uniref:Uncharacterized protein n=1 Tax=Durusdinium trenchii TaxID=1381693 RepID=A0ABP0MRJ4_9DINO
MAFVAPAVLGHGGRAFQATPPPPAGRPAAPPLENGVEFRIKGSSTLSMFLCAAVVATGAQRSGILRRSRARILRRGTGSAATSGSCCRKSQCLHPDLAAGSRSACTQTNLRCLHAQTALAVPARVLLKRAWIPSQ